ncbi:MAG: glycoside hydrolase family 65, partial [Acidobacteria bacterium]
MQKLTRRFFIQGLAAAGAAPVAWSRDLIDRERLVTRHNPVITALDPFAPLSVGNGEIAFTADITGLQTFTAPYESGIPLCTQSQWGWHSFPALPGKTAADLILEEYQTGSRTVGYATRREGQEELYNWLRENPHRLNLGRIRLDIRHRNGEAVQTGDLSHIRQTLDLWSGLLKSRFQVDGEEISVTTACHPRQDLLAFVVDSPLLSDGRLALAVDFPHGSPRMNAADWSHPDHHRSEIVSQSARRLEITRVLDETEYTAGIAWDTDATAAREGAHSFSLRAKPGTNILSAVVRFSEQAERAEPPSADATIAASRAHWASFWSSGAAVELAGSTDQRAQELERRLILSQYLTAIQCSGSLPPQETGLTCNSWYGKFHLEMHLWHSAHFPLWGRPALLERSLDWYRSILPAARERARDQGYRGARWPKMSGPEGRDSPSPIGPLLVWQQPHPIVYAELCY